MCEVSPLDSAKNSFPYTCIVHRCGPGGSVRACHAGGPGSTPCRDKFPGWEFSSPVRQMS